MTACRSLTLEEIIALAQFNIKAKSLAFSSAYIDDCATHEGSNLVSYGGIVADMQNWPLIQDAWIAALKGENVLSFHASDFNNSRGEFKGWNYDRKAALSIRLIDALLKGKCFFVAYACSDKHFNRFIKEFAQESGFNIAKFCLEMCVGYLMDIMYLFPDLDPMDVNVAKRQQQRGLLMNTWESQLEYPEYRKAYRLEKIGFLEHNERVPFQMADFIAYEYYKHIVNFHSGRPMRKSLYDIVFRYLSPMYYFSEESVREELELRHKFVEDILKKKLS